MSFSVFCNKKCEEEEEKEKRDREIERKFFFHFVFLLTLFIFLEQRKKNKQGMCVQILRCCCHDLEKKRCSFLCIL